MKMKTKPRPPIPLDPSGLLHAAPDLYDVLCSLERAAEDATECDPHYEGHEVLLRTNYGDCMDILAALRKARGQR